jgi:4-hydroxybenzoate polyprenyltransferase
MRPRVALVLGRVSNLPTVLSNVLAGIALSGLVPSGDAIAAIAGTTLALVLFYVGGMYLNDAFDAEIDAHERPTRPIPRGDADRLTVFVLGFELLGLGLLLTAAFGRTPGFAGIALGLAIVLYNAVHKFTATAPVLMGLCRLLCYGTAAAMAGGDLDAPLLLAGAVGLFCHVVGLTYAARQEAYGGLGAVWPLAVLAVPLLIAFDAALEPLQTEALAFAVSLFVAVAVGVFYLLRRAPGDVPHAVGVLIAAIALYDATLVAAFGESVAAIVAALCFPATLALQRIVPGT